MSDSLNPPPNVDPSDWNDWLRELSRHPLPVPASRKAHWLKAVIDRDPLRVDWHINRSWSISGTRVGPLVAEWEGNDDPFGRTASSVGREMLLYTPPLFQTRAMKRGTRIEPIIRELFEEGDWLKDVGFSADTPIERLDYPEIGQWIEDGVSYSVSPDGLYKIGGMIFVVDFKAPGDTVHNELNEGEISHYEAYELQIDHGRHALEKVHGIQTHGGLLVGLDWKRWTLIVSPNDHTKYQDNVERIRTASHHFWHEYFIKGELPPNPKPKVFEIQQGPEADKVNKDVCHYVVAKAVADQAKAAVERAKNRLVESFVGSDLPPKLQIGPEGSVHLSITYVPDPLAIEEQATGLGVKIPTHEIVTDEVDLQAVNLFFQRYGKEVPMLKKVVPDFQAAAEVMIGMGVPRQNLYETTYRLNQSRKATAPSGAVINAARQEVEADLKKLIANVVEEIEKIVEDPQALANYAEISETKPKRKAKGQIADQDKPKPAIQPAVPPSITPSAGSATAAPKPLPLPKANSVSRPLPKKENRPAVDLKKSFLDEGDKDKVAPSNRTNRILM